MILIVSILDLIVGDPDWLPHPVQIIGSLISILKKIFLRIAKNKIFFLRTGGFLLAAIVVSFSGYSAWLLERFVLENQSFHIIFRILIIVLALTSSLAAGSLRYSVKRVIDLIPIYPSGDNLILARKELSKIVGRDVMHLDKEDIYRALAETTSENSVDGIFGPLFWMFIGASFWELSNYLPGPLCMVWIYKAASTMDSMIGYRKGRLLWFGTAGARLEDYLTWLPCRFVLLTLPLVSKPLLDFSKVVKKSYKEGKKDLSPNSGLSESIFANCGSVRMGGINKYQNKFISKPILAREGQMPNKESVFKLQELSLRLETFWLFCILIFSIILI